MGIPGLKYQMVMFYEQVTVGWNRKPGIYYMNSTSTVGVIILSGDYQH